MQSFQLFLESKEKDNSFKSFAKKRQEGAEKITNLAKSNGGVAKLTQYHFEIKLPSYQRAAKGNFDVKDAERRYRSLLGKIQSLTMTQKSFQEMLGELEVLGELILASKGRFV